MNTLNRLFHYTCKRNENNLHKATFASQSFKRSEGTAFEGTINFVSLGKWGGPDEICFKAFKKISGGNI